MSTSEDTAAKQRYMAQRSSPSRLEPWMKPEVQARVPDMNGAFDRANDPRANLGVVQSQGSRMVEQDAPRPVPRPSPAIAAGVDAQNFNQRWNAERERHKQSLSADRSKLEALKTEFSNMSQAVEDVKHRAQPNQLKDMERQLYIKERQSESVQMQATLHVRAAHKFTSSS